MEGREDLTRDELLGSSREAAASRSCEPGWKDSETWLSLTRLEEAWLSSPSVGLLTTEEARAGIVG